MTDERALLAALARCESISHVERGLDVLAPCEAAGIAKLVARQDGVDADQLAVLWERKRAAVAAARAWLQTANAPVAETELADAPEGGLPVDAPAVEPDAAVR